MSKNKGSKPAAAETATPVATVTEQVKAPVQKKGNSTIASPVAQVWMICLNAFAAAATAGSEKPSRKALVAACQDAGIAYYTSRTQVQAYLKASKGGSEIPAKLPRNVALVGPAPALQS